MQDPESKSVSRNLTAGPDGRASLTGSLDVLLVVEKLEMLSLTTGVREKISVADIEDHIQHCEEIVKVKCTNDPLYKLSIQALGRLYGVLSIAKDEFREVDTAIEICKQGLGIAFAENEGSVPWVLDSLGRLYTARFRSGSDITDLESAIQEYAKGIEILNGEPPYFSFLDDHTNMKANHVVSMDLLSDSENTIEKFISAALGSKSRGGPRFNDRRSFDISIQVLEDSLVRMSLDHPRRLQRQLLLARAFRSRWVCFGDDIKDLGMSIGLHEDYLDLLQPADDLSRQALLGIVGMLYMQKFDIFGAQEDFEAAVQKFQQAVETATEPGLSRSELLVDLSDAYTTKFDRTGDVDDLEISIRHYEEAFKTMPENLTPSKRFHILSRLAMGYYKRWESLQSMADLDISIRLSKDALRLIPDHPDLQLSEFLVLGISHRARSRRTGNLNDLDDSISCLTRAWELVSDDQKADQSTISLTLARSLLQRYEAIEEEEDFSQSIKKFEEPLHFAKDQDQHLEQMVFSQLVTAHLIKYEKTNETEDLDNAIAVGDKLVFCFRGSHPNSIYQFIPLLDLYEKVSSKTGEETDHLILVEAIETALTIAEDDDPKRGNLLERLGVAYERNYGRLERKADFDMTISNYEAAFLHPSSPIETRLHAGRSLSECYMEAQNTEAAYQTVIETLSLVSKLTPQSLELSDKQHVLKQIVGLPSLVVAVALTAEEEPYKVVQHLERGRGTIISSLSDLRVNTLELEFLHPELAEEFIQLRNELDTSPESIEGHFNPRYNANSKLDSIVETIRRLPGFDRFLLPVSEEQLKAAAAHGAIVIINVNIFRCDALILESETIRVLELPKLEEMEVETYAKKGKIDREILEWLWDTIACPVLRALGHNAAPASSRWPRVFWIPTGYLTHLPIHAAGYHYRGSMETVMDRVISCYSSSVMALIRGRQNASKVSRHFEKAVIFGVHDLHHAPREVSEVEKICTAMNLETRRERPFRQEAIDALADCDIFHFAGHGMTHNSDPSKSYLKLNDTPLTVQDVFNMKLQGRAPFMAYLSACSTGRTEQRELVDESMHLIGAYQLAGFRHVIGTLRVVEDAICAEVARLTYGRIKDQNLADESVSEGLNYALRIIRDQWIFDQDHQDTIRDEKNNKGERSSKRIARDILQVEDSPIYWAPFVYFGIDCCPCLEQ